MAERYRLSEKVLTAFPPSGLSIRQLLRHGPGLIHIDGVCLIDRTRRRDPGSTPIRESCESTSDMIRWTTSSNAGSSCAMQSHFPSTLCGRRAGISSMRAACRSRDVHTSKPFHGSPRSATTRHSNPSTYAASEPNIRFRKKVSSFSRGSKIQSNEFLTFDGIRFQRNAVRSLKLDTLFKVPENRPRCPVPGVSHVGACLDCRSMVLMRATG